jgi:hypothetical protein
MAATSSAVTTTEKKDPNSAYWNRYYKNPDDVKEVLKGPDFNMKKYMQEVGWVPGVSRGYRKDMDQKEVAEPKAKKTKGTK